MHGQDRRCNAEPQASIRSGRTSLSCVSSSLHARDFRMRHLDLLPDVSAWPCAARRRPDPDAARFPWDSTPLPASGPDKMRRGQHAPSRKGNPGAEGGRASTDDIQIAGLKFVAPCDGRVTQFHRAQHPSKKPRATTSRQKNVGFSFAIDKEWVFASPDLMPYPHRNLRCLTPNRLRKQFRTALSFLNGQTAGICGSDKRMTRIQASASIVRRRNFVHISLALPKRIPVLQQ